MDVEIKTTIDVSISTLAESMSLGEIAALLSAVALRFDGDFHDRAGLAVDFADNTSELGARFMAEIIAQRVPRQRQDA